MKLSLAMITKNCADRIERCLASVVDIVDEVVIADGGSTDGTIERITAACSKVPLIVVHYTDPEQHPEFGWTSDFSKQRIASFEPCTGDAILWLDSDDELIHPLELRQVCEYAFTRKPMPFDSIEVRYDYQYDDSGNCVIRQTRPRVLARGAFTWSYPVHEDPLPLKRQRVFSVAKANTFVKHNKSDRDSQASAERNLWVMQNHIAHGRPMNDRMWQNIGSSLACLSRHEEAIPYFERAIAEGGVNDETDYQSLMRLGDSLRKIGRFERSVNAFMGASRLFPDRSMNYMAVAEVENHVGRHDQALFWCSLGEMVSGDERGPSWNPTLRAGVPTFIKALGLLGKSDVPGALEQYEKLREIYPREPSVQQTVEELRRVVANQTLYEYIVKVAEACPQIAQEILWNAPKELSTFPEIAKARRPARPEGKPVIAFFCGKTHEPWGPASLETGIGGSEEAVILLSREFAAAGFHVEVYAFPPAEAIGADAWGVVWLPYYAWDEKAPAPDIYVRWRGWQETDHQALGASQRWLWLHDFVDPAFFDHEAMEHWDAVFCLTEFHARPLPAHAREKLVMTKNGLNPEFFVEGDNASHRFVYASSPDRGMLQLLREWGKIKAELPDAELHLYYGFTKTYLWHMGRQPKLAELKADIETLAKQPGVVWHGMVGQLELAAGFASCGFWLYPTSWPETSCITSMKAQALGAIPITSRFADSGVPETTVYDLGPDPHGKRMDNDQALLSEWTQRVLDAARRNDLQPMREEMKAWARQTYSWKAVADQWIALWKARSSDGSPLRHRPLLTVAS